MLERVEGVLWEIIFLSCNYMYENLIDKSEINITTDEMDEIQERILEIAESRSL